MLAETPNRKIILATRIAETSLTISGVKVVIDIGFDRILKYDHKKRMQVSVFDYISQIQANQRAGRAGRTASG